MQTIPFYIDQTGGISIAQLAARARSLASAFMPVVISVISCTRFSPFLDEPESSWR
jgi:replicative DNA helicase